MGMGTKASQYRPAEPARVERREAMRLPVAISGASVRKLTEQPADALLCDLSVYGCRIEAQGVFKADERVWVRLAGGLPIAGSVVWVDGDMIGCRFDVPIARTTLRSVVLSLV